MKLFSIGIVLVVLALVGLVVLAQVGAFLDMGWPAAMFLPVVIGAILVGAGFLRMVIEDWDYL